MKTQLILSIFLIFGCCCIAQSQMLSVTSVNLNSTNRTITYTVKNQTNDSLFVFNAASLISNYGDIYGGSYSRYILYDSQNNRLSLEYFPLIYDGPDTKPILRFGSKASITKTLNIDFMFSEFPTVKKIEVLFYRRYFVIPSRMGKDEETKFVFYVN